MNIDNWQKSELAKLLSQIHSKSMLNFYSEDVSTFWDELDDKTNLEGDVDKDFFLRMSIYIIEKISTEKDKIESLAKVLYDVHSSHLVGFYISKGDFNKYRNDKASTLFMYNWENLEEDLSDDDVVDRKFFRKMSKIILDELHLSTAKNN